MQKRNRLSALTVLILSASIVLVRFSPIPDKALSWDVFGYYLYLPANFIYHDPGLNEPGWLDGIAETYQPSPTLYQLVPGNDGRRVIKYTAGLALLYSPFFFVANGLAPMLGYPADGFSLPYQISLSLGGVLWAIAGLIFLRRLLLHFFDDRISSLTLFLIVAGTNYLHLAALDGTLLSHNFLFTLYTLLLLSTIQWHRKPAAVYAAAIGLECGLISLIRPSEVVCVLIPLLWNTGTKAAFQTKLMQFRKHPFHGVIAVAAALAAGSVQLIYWKSVTGSWIFYSYNNPGEGFRFFPPYLWQFLFSFRKGWFVYTPLALVAIAGFIPLYRKYAPVFPAAIAFILLDLWIVSSWSCWWYAGGSFSARAIVPAYVLLALPLGALVEDMVKSARRWLFYSLLVLLVVLNLFQSWQFENGILDKERMTRAYYRAVFGKTSIDKQKLDPLLLVERSTGSTESPESINRYKERVIFGSDTTVNADTAAAIRLDAKTMFAAGPDIPYSELTNSDHVWIKASAELLLPPGYKGKSPLLAAAFHYKGDAYKYRAEGIPETDYKPGTWQKISFWYLSPEVRTKNDNLKVYIWQREPEPVYIRNFIVEAFEPEPGR